MASTTTEREFSGFAPGTTAREVFPDGTYRATLERITEIETQYGPAHKLWYSITNGPDRVTVTEIASHSLGTGSKFMRRIAAVNGLAKMPDNADLATMRTTGPVLVTIAQNERTGYLDIESVAALPIDRDTGEIPNF